MIVISLNLFSNYVRSMLMDGCMVISLFTFFMDVSINPLRYRPYFEVQYRPIIAYDYIRKAVSMRIEIFRLFITSSKRFHLKRFIINGAF